VAAIYCTHKLFLSKPIPKDDCLQLCREIPSDMASLAEWRPPARYPKLTTSTGGTQGDSFFSVLRRVATSISHAKPLDSLRNVVELVSEVVPCDSCLLYVLQDRELVLSASKNPHPGVVDRLKLKAGSSMTIWAEHKEFAVIAKGAGLDPRFRLFNEVPKDRYEAFLSLPLVGRGKPVGVINLQSRVPYEFSQREIGLVSAIGYLAGAEIEMARLEEQNIELSQKIETRTLVERAKGILQADLQITEQEAYQKLQRQSQQRRRSMKEIAEAVVLSHALRSQVQA